MELHNIFDNIFGSRSKIRILRLLFKHTNREFTGREIAKMINMSPNSVNLSLRDLKRTNIFTYKQIGKTHIYKINQESILFNIISDLFNNEKQVWPSLINILEKELTNIDTCIIFGSFAAGQEDHDSDLDLLIITDNKEKIQSKIDEIAYEILAKYHTVTNPIILTRKELKMKSKKPYIKNAISKGVTIVGPKPTI